MAVIEICDICKKQIHTSDGIIIKYSDMAGFGLMKTIVQSERNEITKPEFATIALAR